MQGMNRKSSCAMLSAITIRRGAHAVGQIASTMKVYQMGRAQGRTTATTCNMEPNGHKYDGVFDMMHRAKTFCFV